MAIKIINPIINTVDPTLQEKTITENGEYTADEGYDGLSKVTVNVVNEGDGYDLFRSLINATITEVTASDLSGVNKISSYCFYSKSYLKSIVIPDGVTKIEDYGIVGCTALKTVDIAGSVTTIGKYGLNNNAAMNNLILREGLTGIGANGCYGAKSLVNLVLPNTLTTLGASCFYGSTNLKKVVFGSGISSIYANCFASCVALALLDFRSASAVPTLAATSGIPNNTNLQIVVPDELYDTWITATNWTSFTSKIFKASEVTIA